jgi:hypothetical protein
LLAFLCIFVLIINKKIFKMKKLMYLLVAGTMFVFTACNCGTDDAAATEETAVEEVVVEEVAAEEVVEDTTASEEVEVTEE